jgi:predicted O-linked N-acetylglucosamine transferase (SPINDLY family)
MIGDEPHSRTDARILRTVNLPDWLIATDADSYLAAAVRLLQDEPLRRGLRAEAQRIRGDLFAQEHEQFGNDFADTAWWLFRHHARISKLEKKVWTPQDRRAFSPATEVTS